MGCGFNIGACRWGVGLTSEQLSVGRGFNIGACRWGVGLTSEPVGGA